MESNETEAIESPATDLFAKREVRAARIVLLILFIAGAAWFVPPVYKLSGGTVNVQHWHRTRGEITLTVGPGHPTWISFDRISKHALHAIVVAEDARFYEHGGLDFSEIWKSFQTNLRRGRYARGGSTITQQVVKVAFLSQDKNLIRKAREAAGAILLELILSKQEILEWYINLVQFGDGVYGVKEGCWHYFKTKPEQLTIEQAANLALVLPSPNKWSYGLRRGNLTDFGHKRFASIVLRMRKSGYITRTQWEHAMATGNFGGAIHGYRPNQPPPTTDPLCLPGEDCEHDFWDVERDDLSYPTDEEEVDPLFDLIEEDSRLRSEELP